MERTLRRFIAELTCQAEEQGLMDLPVTNLYFPGRCDTLDDGKQLLPIVVEVSEKANNSNTVYGTKVVKRDI